MTVSMPPLQRVLLNALVSLALLSSTLAVCNAHLSAAEHPDCVHCLESPPTSHTDEAPVHSPVSPHHCPNHFCGHLHLLFILSGGFVLAPPVVFLTFLPPVATPEQELARFLLKPPQA